MCWVIFLHSLHCYLSGPLGKSGVRKCNLETTNEYLGNITFSTVPDPVVIKDGRKVEIFLAAELLKKIPKGSKVKLDIKQLTGLKQHFPCLQLNKVDSLISYENTHRIKPG